jgi:hypothetical protein
MSLISRSLDAPKVIYDSSRCRRQLQRLKATAGPEDLVDLLFDSPVVTPLQVSSELLRLLRIVEQLRPRTVLEIGTANGGTLFPFCRLATRDALLISVDLPGGGFGPGYSAWRVPLYKSFASPCQTLHLVRGDSHSDATFQTVTSLLNGRRVDLLFIDGDHTYEGVKCDFERYAPLVPAGGLIAFHDISAHPASTGCEVSRLWRELKVKYEYEEFIEDPNQGWAGIGVIRK